MTEIVDTVVVGGGQAGLAISWHLSQLGREHLVLERGRIAEHWRSGVWESFCLVTPNWSVQLPGFGYDGGDPDGFMGRHGLVDYIERYAAYVGTPLRTGVEVTTVRQTDDGYWLDTTDGPLKAWNVVVTGGKRPRVPLAARQIPASVHQIHSSEYRNPDRLAPGAVLVVGTGQSGAQISEELYKSGRQVHLSVSRCGRGPRRYRGHDTMWWMARMGMLSQTVDQLPAELSDGCNLHVSGKDGGHDLNLRQFARDGVWLLGRLEDAAGGRLRFGPDLRENLRSADQAAARIMSRIDEYVVKSGIDAPEAEPVGAADETPLEERLELDLASAGVRTVVWATGYRHDFSWVRLPMVGADGKPIHRRGVTEFPGLYLLGLRLLHRVKSDLLFGVGDDAAYLAEQIAKRRRRS